jgi:hypothetical protein
MIRDEIEPTGGFAGDFFVLPILLRAQVLTALTSNFGLE